MNRLAVLTVLMCSMFANVLSAQSNMSKPKAFNIVNIARSSDVDRDIPKTNVSNDKTLQDYLVFAECDSAETLESSDSSSFQSFNESSSFDDFDLPRHSSHIV